MGAELYCFKHYMFASQGAFNRNNSFAI